MSWRAGITTKRKYRTGYSLHDEIYCTYGKITSKEEAMKRVASAWKKKKCDTEHDEIYCYQSKL